MVVACDCLIRVSARKQIHRAKHISKMRFSSFSVAVSVLGFRVFIKRTMPSMRRMRDGMYSTDCYRWWLKEYKLVFVKLRALKTVVASCSCFFTQIFQCVFSLRCHGICWCAVSSFLSLYLFSSNVLIISVPLIRGQGVAILWSCLSLICGGKLACDSLVILQWSN